MRALVGLQQIEVRGPGLFQAYVRKAILNRIRDELRRARLRPGAGPLEQIQDRAPSPLEVTIGADVLDRYERAMAQLGEEERRLLHLRIELDLTFEEVGAMTQRSPDAARMAATRALSKLSRFMGHER